MLLSHFRDNEYVITINLSVYPKKNYTNSYMAVIFFLLSSSAYYYCLLLPLRLENYKFIFIISSKKIKAFAYFLRAQASEWVSERKMRLFYACHNNVMIMWHDNWVLVDYYVRRRCATYVVTIIVYPHTHTRLIVRVRKIQF